MCVCVCVFARVYVCLCLSRSFKRSAVEKFGSAKHSTILAISHVVSVSDTNWHIGTIRKPQTVPHLNSHLTSDIPQMFSHITRFNTAKILQKKKKAHFTR